MKNQDDLLDPAVRKRIIEDIKGTENTARKNEMYKRYQCYKDQTFRYVQMELFKQFDASTVHEMSYCLSNIAIVRKVIDKLARVYKYGVEREVFLNDKESKESTAALKGAVDESDANRKLKKCNRYFKLFKNTVMYIRPTPVSGDADALKCIKMDPLPPYLYDVVEVEDDREKPMVYVLSDFSPAKDSATGNPVQAVVPGTDGRGGNTVNAFIVKGDGIDQSIADTPGDEKSKGYVFWSDKYHFVCNDKGDIIGGPEDKLNPINELPFVNYAEDQDGSFWAIGGNDLTDGAVLMNSMITNILHIGVTQGFAQIVATGKDFPKNAKVGPNKIIFLHQQEGDPNPTFEYKNSNPPLDELRALVEMYVALLLTTNNLSTSGVASNLNGGAQFPSGIAMMIDKAESMEDVEDQRQIFVDNEPCVWELYAKWYALLVSRKELVEEQAKYPVPVEFDLRVKFSKPVAIESEKERLEVLKIKKDLGIISMVDMIKAENPELTDKEAEEKLMKILEEAMKRKAEAMGENGGDNDDELGDELNAGDKGGRGDEAPGGGVPGGADSEDGGEPEEPDNGGTVPGAKPKV